MATAQPIQPSRLAAFLLVVGVLIVLDQLAILVAPILPPEPASLEWRYRAVGLATGRLTPLLFADALLVIGALLGEYRRLIQFLAGAHVVLALLLVGTVIGFALDAIQLRRTLSLAVRRDAMTAAGRAVAMLTLTVPVAIWAAVRLFRLGTSLAEGQGRDGAGRPLVVGQGGEGQ